MNELQQANLHPHIFSTKKLSEAQTQAFNHNIRVASEDFIKINFNRISPLLLKKELKNVVFTSQNAVESLLTNCSPEALKFENIYCVGRKTRRLIQRKIGKVTHFEKNAAALANYLVEYIEGTELTYFHGNLSLETLPSILEEHQITVNKIEAYRTKLDGKKLHEDVEGVLFYSPSTINSYLNDNEPKAVAYCIGETTASEARKHFKDVRVAKIPDVESVIDLVNDDYKAP